MSATERLYYRDSHLLEFDARVIDVSERDDGAIALTLDRTAFYPTGGGQPNDTGTLGEARVIDCIDAEEEGVLHLVQGPVPQIGDTVHGKIDSLRRLDHLQQHTGQHILSAAFVKLFDAATHSFRVMEHECEIDVALQDPTDEKIQRAVDLANQTIWQNLPIAIHEVTAAEAARLPLRKDAAREGELRVIEITGVDLTPCGGTHAQATGEVGVIAVRGWERAKGLTRIQFMAGGRVVDDYRKANRIVTETAALFSCARDDTPSLITKLIDENKKLVRRVRELDQIACQVEAEDMLRGETVEGSTEASPRIISKIFNDRDADSLKHLALALVAHARVIALLASRDNDTARLVFARSADASGDMNALMRRACEMIDGRGGGKPDLAQGGGKNVEAIQETLAAAETSVRQTSPSL
ncbi:MAG TPA: DHHA1 domain-containing protein [Pyrinomonadaceae bacterium]|jgi:alanyl-tRNA synthetase|nr:DHHA1 domain-containing protein [Pyrinomonadaceae bacterium]